MQFGICVMADIDEVGCPDEAAAAARIESIRRRWAS